MWRHLAAAAYDGLLLLALWLTASLVADFVQDLGGFASGPHWMQALRIYLFVLGLFMFGWFWTHGGQTPGLKAWRLRLQRADGASLRWPVAAVRYSVMLVCWGCSLAPLLLLTPLRGQLPQLEPVAWSCLALFCTGLVVSAIDPQHRSPADHAAGTRIVASLASRSSLVGIAPAAESEAESAHAEQPPNRQQSK